MKLAYAVTGANGQIGSYLVSYLRKQGHVVYELTRGLDKCADKNYYKFFDLSLPDQMPALAEIDVLIHTAHFFNTLSKEYETINLEGTKKLFKEAQRSNIKQTIFISSISAYSTAKSRYGQLKYKIEQRLSTRYKNVIIVRPGLIFHTPYKGITATVETFVKKLPIIPLINSGKQLIFPCFLEDLAQLICSLSNLSWLSNTPIIAAAKTPLTFKQLIQYFTKQQAKKNKPLIPIPFFGIYFSLKFIELLKLPLGLRSDNLLGLQFINPNIDFSTVDSLPVTFKSLSFNGLNS